MRFDARAAKLLEAGQHLIVDGCPGLRLVATATVKTWTYRYKELGGSLMKQIALGRWPAMPVQAAVVAWAGLREQREAGQDPGQVIRKTRRVGAVAPGHPRDSAAPGAYLVRALVRDFVTGHLMPNLKPAGALAAQRALERLLTEEPEFAGLPAHDVTRGVAFALLDARRQYPMAAAKLRSWLGAAWAYALDAGRLPGDTPNWWRQVLAGKLRSKGKVIGGEHVGKMRRTLPPVEVGALLLWSGQMQAYAHDALVLYLWTCARGVEILSMLAEHVTHESDGWWWTVPKAATKNARFADAVDLRVPLVGRALEVVQRRLAMAGSAGWLFDDGEGNAYRQKTLSTYIYDLQPYSAKALRRSAPGLVLPVTHWSPHNLRRTSRTLLAGLGCPGDVAEAVLGHMPKDIEATYNTHSYDAERRLWLGRLAQRLEELEALAKDHAAGLPARP